VWTGFIWLRIWTVAGPSEHGIEPSVSIKCGGFLDQLNDYYIFKKGLFHGVS
jgi:hypothetical protein